MNEGEFYRTLTQLLNDFHEVRTGILTYGNGQKVNTEFHIHGDPMMPKWGRFGYFGYVTATKNGQPFMFPCGHMKFGVGIDGDINNERDYYSIRPDAVYEKLLDRICMEMLKS